MTRWLRTALWLGASVLVVAPIPAYFSVPVPPVITLTLAALTVLAAWRPRDAVLVVAALAPLTGAVHALAALPYDSSALLEVFLLGLLGGALVRAAVVAAPLPSSRFELSVLALAALAIASCIALLPTAGIRAGTSDWPGAVVDLMRRMYFQDAGAFAVLELTAPVVEGAALAVLVSRTFRTAGEARRLMAMTVLGGAAAAALNVHRLLEVSVRRPPVLASLLETLRKVRFNTQFGDLNAAGSYYALVTIMAGWRAGLRDRSGRLYLAALPLLACALWVSGSRTALSAALAGLLVAFVVSRHGDGFRPRLSRPRLVAVLAGILGVAALLVFLLPLTRHGSFWYSVETRVALTQTGLRMAADRPLFGVGTTQYYARFQDYAPPHLLQTFESELGYAVPRENAHNQFVQVLAELGILGLAALLLALWFAVGTAGEHGPAARVAVFGFLFTALAGHPLLTPMVSAPFWIVLGLAAAGTPQARRPVPRAGGWLFAVLIAAVVVTMPWRWRVERADADLAGVTMGLSNWEAAGAERFRTADGRATLFVSRWPSLVRIPVRSGGGQELTVEILLDGRPAGAARAFPDRWTDIDIPLMQRDTVPRFRRIDLTATPSPAVLHVGRISEAAR